MKMRAKMFLVLALLVSSVALAKYVGRFYCGTSCEVGQGFARGDTFNFIYSTVNRSVNGVGGWIDSNGNPNQVTICNGTKCSLYTYVKLSGQFIAEGYYYSNWTGGGGGSFSGGACGVESEVVGYTEVYRIGTTCTPEGGCSTQKIPIGYEPIYGATGIAQC